MKNNELIMLEEFNIKLQYALIDERTAVWKIIEQECARFLQDHKVSGKQASFRMKKTTSSPSKVPGSPSRSKSPLKKPQPGIQIQAYKSRPGFIDTRPQP